MINSLCQSAELVFITVLVNQNHCGLARQHPCSQLENLLLGILLSAVNLITCISPTPAVSVSEEYAFFKNTILCCMKECFM